MRGVSAFSSAHRTVRATEIKLQTLGSCTPWEIQI